MTSTGSLNGSVADADPDDGHWNFFYSEGPWNTHGYINPEVDSTAGATRATADRKAGGAFPRDAGGSCRRTSPYAFLYHTIDITGLPTTSRATSPMPEMRYLETLWLDR